MPAPPIRPATPALGVAAVLLGLLGAAALAYGALGLAATNPNRPIVGLGTGLLLIAYGVALVAVGIAVFRGRRWSRGPAVATSLIQLPVAWSFAGGETWAVAIGLAAISVVVLICLLVRSSTAVFVPESAAAVESDPEQST